MHREFLQKLTTLVEDNLSNENFGPEELAKKTGMSQSNLNRKLKFISKQTISQFIREVRLKKAKELIQKEDLTAAEISYRVGFGSPTYFNNCFHEYFGVTPGEMKNHEAENESFEQPVEASPKKSKSSKIFVVLVVSIIVLLPLAYFLVNKFSVFKTVEAKEKSIAVLPFINLSNDTLNQYQANAIMVAIQMNLSKIKDLRVISRPSVEQYRGSDKTAAEIGRELNVAYLLEGSFQKVDNQIRLIVLLIKTKDENQVWSNIYDRNWEDIFEVQSEVAETVARELQAFITPEEKQLIRKVPTLNLTAYDFYQKGNEEYNRFRIYENCNMQVLKKAEDFYKKALELDSTMASAYCGLANVCYFKNLCTAYGSEDYLDSILILTNKALVFDNQSAEAIRIRGDYFFAMDKPDQAIKEYNRAGKLSPNDWEVYFNIGLLSMRFYDDYLMSIKNFYETIKLNRGPELPFTLNFLREAYQHAGFIEKAKQCNQEILKLTNDTSSIFNIWLNYEFGNYEEAFTEVKIKGPNNPLWGGKLLLSILSGHDKESYIYALNAIEWIKKNNINPINDAHRIGYGLWVGGNREEAEYYLKLQIENDLKIVKEARLGSLFRPTHYDLAAVYAFTGDKEKAYQHLEELNKKKNHPLYIINIIKHDPLFNSLRDESRFQDIVKDMEAKYQAEHDRVAEWLAEQGML